MSLDQILDQDIFDRPSHAHDVAENKPTAMVLAINNKEEELIELQKNLSSECMRIYRSDDRIESDLAVVLKMFMPLQQDFLMVLGLAIMHVLLY